MSANCARPGGDERGPLVPGFDPGKSKPRVCGFCGKARGGLACWSHALRMIELDPADYCDGYVHPTCLRRAQEAYEERRETERGR